MAYTFSGKELIAHFGTPAELRDLLARHHVPLSYAQIRKWHDRDNITADGLAALMMLARVMRKPFDPIKAIKADW